MPVLGRNLTMGYKGYTIIYVNEWYDTRFLYRE